MGKRPLDSSRSACGVHDFARRTRRAWYNASGMLMGRWTAWLIVAALAVPLSEALHVDGAFAATSPTLVGFSIVADETASCGGESFTSQLLRRAPGARIALPTEPALSIEVRLRSEPGVVRGLLTLKEVNGFVTERDVTGASCAEVTAALALIAAVFLDPNLSSDIAPVEPVRSDGVRESPASPGSWRFQVGPALSVQDAAAPGLVPALSLVVEAEPAREQLVSPLFGLSVTRSASSRVEVQTSAATLRFTAARLYACPLAFHLQGLAALRPCGLVEAGVLDAAGTETADPQSVRAPWLAPGASLRLELNLLTILVIGLEGGVVAPLFRHEFFFDPDTPDTVVFEVPTIGKTAQVGLLARFE